MIINKTNTVSIHVMMDLCQYIQCHCQNVGRVLSPI